jgi:DNA-directed RNA polymerase specialized sigma24 family protein
MLKAFRRLDAFEVRRRHALRAYLQQAIQNRIRDELRKVSRAPAIELSDELPDPKPSVLDNIITAQAEERYKAALGRLRSEDRELIVGRFELDYSFEQLALITRRASISATRMALSRALAKLSAEMARE